MDLAGDVIQALAVFLNLDDLQTTADFPHEMEKLREILVKVLLKTTFLVSITKKNFQGYNKGVDQPAHPRSTIVVSCLDSIIPILAKSKISRL